MGGGEPGDPIASIRGTSARNSRLSLTNAAGDRTEKRVRREEGKKRVLRGGFLDQKRKIPIKRRGREGEKGA